MTTIRYSAATGGFYDTRLHAAIPDDAVTITAASHARLMRAQGAGLRIVARGVRPSIARPTTAPIEQLRDRARAAVRETARAQIYAIASLEQQSNDNAALAVAAIAGALSDQAAAALDRRVRIDAIRARANGAQADIATLDRDALDAFDARAAFGDPAA
jgi:hypothetical protein